MDSFRYIDGVYYVEIENIDQYNKQKDNII